MTSPRIGPNQRQKTFRELQIELVELAERGRDASPLLPFLAENFRDAQAAQYASGRGWKPLSPEYVAAKAAGRTRTRNLRGDSRRERARSTKVGTYTGGLASSLTNANDPFHIERFTKDKSFVIGSSNPVSNLFGGKHKTRKQPKRKPVRFTPAMRRQWLAWVQQFLVDGSTP